MPSPFWELLSQKLYTFNALKSSFPVPSCFLIESDKEKIPGIKFCDLVKLIRTTTIS